MHFLAEIKPYYAEYCLNEQKEIDQPHPRCYILSMYRLIQNFLIGFMVGTICKTLNLGIVVAIVITFAIIAFTDSLDRNSSDKNQ